MRNVAERRKRPHRSGAIFRVRWSGDVSGARPRHVRLRVVSRFSALQKACQNIEWRQMRAFLGSVLEWCGRAVPARLLPQELPSGRAVPARTPAEAAPATASRPNGSCLAAERFLPRGQTVPARPDGSCLAKRFLPNGSCPAEIENCKFPIPHYQLAADSSHDSPRTGCSPYARLSKTGRWALALRPEHHPRSDQSGHVEQPACRTRCPKEPHAQRSWHLQQSLPAQSEDLRTEVWLAESLRRRGARPTPRSHSLLEDPSRLGPFHARGGPSGCSRGRLEATAAVHADGCGIHLDHREAAPDVVGATRRTPP